MPRISTTSRSNPSAAMEERLARAALGGTIEAPESPARSSAEAATEAPRESFNTEARHIPVGQLLETPIYGRSYFPPDEMADLVASVHEHGILEPVLVRPNPKLPHSTFPYELVAGYRRLNAARAVGLTTVPAIIKELDDVEAAAASLTENMQRVNPDPADQARAFQNLQDTMQSELDKALTKLAGGTYGAIGDQPKLRKLSAAHYGAMVDEYRDMKPWLVRVFDRVRNQNGKMLISTEDLAAVVNLKPRAIEYKRAIARLPEDILKKISEGGLTEKEARFITQLQDKDPEALRKKQLYLGSMLVRERRSGNPMPEAMIRAQVAKMGARGASGRGGEVDVADALESSTEFNDAEAGASIEAAFGENSPAPGTPTTVAQAYNSSGVAVPAPERQYVALPSGGRAAASGDPALAAGAALHVWRTTAASILQQLETSVLWATDAKSRMGADFEAYYDKEIGPSVLRVKANLKPIHDALAELEKLGEQGS